MVRTKGLGWGALYYVLERWELGGGSQHGTCLMVCVCVCVCVYLCIHLCMRVCVCLCSVFVYITRFGQSRSGLTG